MSEEPTATSEAPPSTDAGTTTPIPTSAAPIPAPMPTPGAPALPPEAYPEPAEELPEGKRWSRLRPVHMVIAVALSLVAFFGLQFVVAIAVVAKIVAEDPEGAMANLGDQAAMMEALTADPVIALATILVSQVPLILLPIASVWLAKANIREALGIKSPNWPVVGLTVVGILAIGPTADLIVRTMQETFPDWSLGALDNLAAVSQRYPWWVLWPFIALLPGVAEELFFRGLVQRPLGFGWGAVLTSGLFFAFFHIDPHHVAGVIPLGIWLSWTAARSGSTVTTMIAHAVNNTAALVSMKLAGDAVAEAEAPLWAVLLGVVIFVACTYGVYRLTQDRSRAEGLSAKRQPIPLGPPVDPEVFA